MIRFKSMSRRVGKWNFELRRGLLVFLMKKLYASKFGSIPPIMTNKREGSQTGFSNSDLKRRAGRDKNDRTFVGSVIPVMTRPVPKKKPERMVVLLTAIGEGRNKSKQEKRPNATRTTVICVKYNRGSRLRDNCGEYGN